MRKVSELLDVIMVEKMPALKAEIKFECVSCGEHNTTELKGLQSFFT